MNEECFESFGRIHISGLLMCHLILMAKILGPNVHGCVLNSGNWNRVSVKFGKSLGSKVMPEVD